MDGKELAFVTQFLHFVWERLRQYETSLTKTMHVCHVFNSSDRTWLNSTFQPSLSSLTTVSLQLCTV